MTPFAVPGARRYISTDVFARLAGIALGTALLAGSAAADPLTIPVDGDRSPASRYANLSNEDAFAALAERSIAFERVDSAPGVRAPIRLAGPLHGVWIHSALPEEARKSTPFEILDARLALALDDFAAVLARHDVVELVHFTMYRPGDDAREGDTSGKARHPGGMAIDVGALRKRSGALLTVQTHWPAAIGARTCGEGGRHLPARRGRELLSLACEAKDLRLFHVILTPHFNRAHRDHLHLEIKPETKWFLLE
ncbi:MAG TPA: extensin family protein [Polyangiaceae bacterium]|nr:extensin family protein [Polyangiaceae bacterium]